MKAAGLQDKAIVTVVAGLLSVGHGPFSRGLATMLLVLGEAFSAICLSQWGATAGPTQWLMLQYCNHREMINSEVEQVPQEDCVQ